jgi:hypothetical protein
MNLNRIEKWIEFQDVLKCGSCRRCDNIAFAAAVVWVCIFGCGVTLAAAMLW